MFGDQLVEVLQKRLQMLRNTATYPLPAYILAIDLPSAVCALHTAPGQKFEEYVLDC